jgi:hypothetical protein
VYWLIFHWMVPALTAATAAGFLAVAVGAVTGDTRDGLLTFGALGFAFYAGLWLNERAGYLPAVITPVVEMPDEEVPDAPEPQLPRQVWIPKDERGRSHRVVTLPDWLDNVQLQLMSHALAAGESLAEREWTGAGKPFSVREWADLREWMERNKLIEARNPRAPQQGFELTAEGLAAFRHLATHLPHQDGTA